MHENVISFVLSVRKLVAIDEAQNFVAFATSYVKRCSAKMNFLKLIIFFLYFTGLVKNSVYTFSISLSTNQCIYRLVTSTS